MQQTTLQLDGPTAVRNYVNQILCLRDNLEVGSFELTELPLRRGSTVCGLYFCLHGPRLLRLTAIWEMESGTILFYGSQGEKFMKTQIAPLSTDLAQAA